MEGLFSYVKAPYNYFFGGATAQPPVEEQNLLLLECGNWNPITFGDETKARFDSILGNTFSPEATAMANETKLATCMDRFSRFGTIIVISGAALLGAGLNSAIRSALGSPWIFFSPYVQIALVVICIAGVFLHMEIKRSVAATKKLAPEIAPNLSKNNALNLLLKQSTGSDKFDINLRNLRAEYLNFSGMDDIPLPITVEELETLYRTYSTDLKSLENKAITSVTAEAIMGALFRTDHESTESQGSLTAEELTAFLAFSPKNTRKECWELINIFLMQDIKNPKFTPTHFLLLFHTIDLCLQKTDPSQREETANGIFGVIANLGSEQVVNLQDQLLSHLRKIKGIRGEINELQEQIDKLQETAEIKKIKGQIDELQKQISGPQEEGVEPTDEIKGIQEQINKLREQISGLIKSVEPTEEIKGIQKQIDVHQHRIAERSKGISQLKNSNTSMILAFTLFYFLDETRIEGEDRATYRALLEKFKALDAKDPANIYVQENQRYHSSAGWLACCLEEVRDDNKTTIQFIEALPLSTLALGWFAARTTQDIDGETPWEILEIPKTASRAEITRAYRDKSRLVHPDRNKSPEANAEFQRLQAAYEALTSDASSSTANAS